MNYVYVVTYSYDYQGETVEAVYTSKAAAKQHPSGGDSKHIYKAPILKSVRKEGAGGLVCIELGNFHPGQVVIEPHPGRRTVYRRNVKMGQPAS